MKEDNSQHWQNLQCNRTLPYLKNKARVSPQMQISSYQVIKMEMFHKSVAHFSCADICHSAVGLPTTLLAAWVKETAKLLQV